MPFRVTVQRENPDQPKGFSPQELTASVGDAVFWLNEDTCETHQVYPTSGKPGAWGDPFEPKCSSMQVNLDTAGNYPYKCAYHDDESGTLVVS